MIISLSQIFRSFWNIPFQQARQLPRMAQNLPDNRGWSGRFAIDIAGNVQPFERQVDDSAGDLDLFQRLQRCPQHGHLPGHIAGLAQGAAQGIFDGSDARRADRQGQIRNGRQDNGGKSRRFDFALRQSNGPAANRSGRHKNNHIGMFCAQIANHCRDSFLKQCFRL